MIEEVPGQRIDRLHFLQPEVVGRKAPVELLLPRDEFVIQCSQDLPSSDPPLAHEYPAESVSSDVLLRTGMFGGAAGSGLPISLHSRI